MSVLDSWWVHKVQLKTKLGTTAYGDKFDEPFELPCFFQDVTRLIRDASGNEVVSSARIFADLSHADRCTPGSRVTTPAGRDTEILEVSRLDSGSLGGLDHLELSLS